MTDSRVREGSYVVQAYRRFDSTLATAFEYSTVFTLLRRLVNPVDEKVANIGVYLHWLLRRSTLHAMFFGVPTGTIEVTIAVPDHFAERIERLRTAFGSSRIVQLFTRDPD